jgi:hypothetical protein
MTEMAIVNALGALTSVQFDRVLLLLYIRVAQLSPPTVASKARSLKLFRLIKHDQSRHACRRRSRRSVSQDIAGSERKRAR